MAKIDVSVIAGYEDMSIEEKLKALESFEYDNGDSTIRTLKDSVSKASSQAAEWKKKYNGLLSDEEKARQSREEEYAAMTERLAMLEREKTLASYTAKFTSLGYDADLASSTAIAFADGDFDKVLANQQKFNEMYSKKLKADLLMDTPAPQVGVSETKVDKAAFSRMGYTEMMALMQENPELYKELSS